MTDISTRRFVVVGAGGVGGWLLTGLSKMLEFKAPGSTLIIIDGDQYEPKNVERQTFMMAGNKAEVKAAELQPSLKDTMVFPYPCWVVPNDSELVGSGDDEDGSSYLAVERCVQENDVVFAVVDNFATRKLIFEEARKRDNVDVFTGGNDENLFGSVQHYARKDGIDILEHPSERQSEYDNPPDRNPGELSCQERAELEGGTQLIATNMAVAAYLLGRAQKVIFSGEADKEALIYFDLGAGLASAIDRTEEVPIPVPVIVAS